MRCSLSRSRTDFQHHLDTVSSDPIYATSFKSLATRIIACVTCEGIGRGFTCSWCRIYMLLCLSSRVSCNQKQPAMRLVGDSTTISAYPVRVLPCFGPTER